MAENLEDFAVFPFIQELFEDLSLTLPSLGCRFEGTVPPNDLTARARRVTLKNQLFLFFADLAQGHPVLTVKFTLAQLPQEAGYEWCFLLPKTFTPEFHPENLPSWQADFHRVLQAEGGGFALNLPMGSPLQVGPPIDWRELYRLYGSPQAGQEMLENFLRRSESILNDLTQQVKTQNASECFRLAHTLKGAARGVFALPLSTAALKLEMAGRGGDLQDAPQLLDDLNAVYKEMLEWYQRGQDQWPGFS